MDSLLKKQNKLGWPSAAPESFHERIAFVMKVRKKKYNSGTVSKTETLYSKQEQETKGYKACAKFSKIWSQ